MAGPIRQPIDLDSLASYIDSKVPAIKTPLEVKQFGYGQSNPTYLIKDGSGSKFVMRKKPPGKLISKTAHRVDREYRILRALENTDVPVPKTYALCEDEKVIGTPFYIMEFLDGRIFEDPSFPGVSVEERTTMWRDAVQTLAKFHRVSPKSVGLETYGKAGDFYNRQLQLFTGLSMLQSQAKDVDTGKEVGPIPYFSEMVEFFQEEETMPKDRATFVHGDYKIDNLVFHKTEPRVIGILDWEMSTIGHPLSDLANMMNPYTLAANELARDYLKKSTFALTSLKFTPGDSEPGLPTKEQCLQWYAEVAGWGYPKAEETWGDAFSIYRGSIIMQGIAARYAMRQASSTRAAEYGAAMPLYGRVAWELVQGAQKAAASKSKL